MNMHEFRLIENSKSQMAIEYAYQLRERNPGTSIFWIHASNPARFRASFNGIAKELKLPGFDDPKIDTMEIVSRWLARDSSGPRLILLDNADESTQRSRHHQCSDKDMGTILQKHQKAQSTGCQHLVQDLYVRQAGHPRVLASEKFATLGVCRGCARTTQFFLYHSWENIDKESQIIDRQVRIRDFS